MATSRVTMDAFVTGNYAALRGLTLDPQATADTLNKNFQQEYGAVDDPARQQRFMERAAAVSFDEKLRVPQMEQTMRVGLTGLLNGGGLPTATQKQAYVMAQQLYSTTNGPEALSHYVGADNAAKVA